MDTLSTSISTGFTIPKSNLKNHHHLLHSTSTSTSITKPKTTKLSNKTTSFSSTQNHLRPPHAHITSLSSRPSSPLKQSSFPPAHRRPSTGYAVALLDAARRQNAAEAVHRDVKRLSRWLGGDQLRRAMADASTAAAKGEMVKEVVKRGRFEKLVVKLVKMLAEKCKVDLIGQVLSEFGKIYDELSYSRNNEQLLLLPSPLKLKMDQNQILEIVNRIHTQTGADKVTVRTI